MTHEQNPDSAEFLRNARAMQAKVKLRLSDRTGREEFQTRAAQIDGQIEDIFEAHEATDAERVISKGDLRLMIEAAHKSAEARCAEEQRRKDAEGEEPDGWQYQNVYGDWHPITKGSPEWYVKNGANVRPLYTRPANLAALIDEAVAAERERCAKVLDTSAIHAHRYAARWVERYAKLWAAAIRKGGEHG